MTYFTVNKLYTAIDWHSKIAGCGLSCLLRLFVCPTKITAFRKYWHAYKLTVS